MQFAVERTKKFPSEHLNELRIDFKAIGDDISSPMKSQMIRMNSFVLVLGLALAGSVQSVSAQTAQKKSKKTTYTAKDFIASSSAAPENETQSRRTVAESQTHYTVATTQSETRYGLGFASAYNLTASSTALTGWIGLTPKFGIQPLLSIGSTSPFNFSVGGIGKYTIAQRGAGGFHLGGGLSVGSIHKGASTNSGSLFGNSGTASKSGFNMGLAALAGVHYELPNTSLVLHFDGGANFGLADGDTDFNLGTVGSLLGASIIYLF